MQIRSTLQKLLNVYQSDELLRHIANEIEQKANHLETVGAPMKAGILRREVEILRSTADTILKLE